MMRCLLKDQELKKALRLIAVTMCVMLLFYLFIFRRDIYAMYKMSQIEPGDHISVTFSNPNPYEDNFHYEGTILSRRDDFVEYMKENGVIRTTDLYFDFKYGDVVVTKPNQ